MQEYEAYRFKYEKLEEKPLKHFTGADYSEQEVRRNIEAQNKEKYQKLKERISAFKTVKTIEEARELSKSIFPVSNEKTIIRIGECKCVVINKDDNFRISIDSPEEFTSYDFIK